MTSTTSPLDPRDVAAHAESLRALARRLVLDGGAAEDAAQDAWLVALRGAPRGDVPFSWWMRGVVRNVVRNARRDDAVRRRREAAAPIPLETPAPDALVEQAEIHHRLVGAVLALEEPYRTTILMRFFEDLSAAEIARRVDVPAGTVRSRLKRGLDMLRARLDGDEEGDRREWAMALVPLAWGRGTRRVVPSGLAAAACLLVAVGAGIAALHWWTSKGDAASGDAATASPAPHGTTARTAAVRDRAGEAREADADAVATTGARDETTAPPAPAANPDAPNPGGATGASIEVVDEDGNRVREAELVLGVANIGQLPGIDEASLMNFVTGLQPRPLAGTNPLVVGDYPKTWEGVVATAFARVPGLPPTAPESFTVHVGRLASVRLVAAKPRSADVVVLDFATNLPVAGASVVSKTEWTRRYAVSFAAERGAVGPGSATTDVDGRCRVEGLGRGEHDFEIDSKGYVRLRAKWDGGPLRAQLEPQRGSGTVTVKAFDRDGLPFANAKISVYDTDRVVPTNGDGVAVFTDVPPGSTMFTFDLKDFAAEGMADFRAKLPPADLCSFVNVEAGGTYWITLGLAEKGSASVVVRCVGEDGSPIAGISVGLISADTASVPSLATDQDGSARFADLAADGYRPFVAVGPHAAWYFDGDAVTLAQGGYAAKTLTLGSNTVRGRVVAGAERRGVAALIVKFGDGTTRTDADGRFELTRARSGTYDVSADSDVGGARRAGVKVPSDGDVVLELAPYGRVAVRFADADRPRLRDASVRLYLAQGDKKGAAFEAGKGNEDLVCSSALPGSNVVAVALDGRTQWFPVEVASGKTSVVEVRAP
jgi:RNA polymerase sigma-70 factor (ECF subfamily)